MATTSTVAPVNHRVPLLAAAAIVLGALVIGVLFSANIGLLMIVGGLLGMVLYHAAFGFTAAWRVFITERRGRGLRAQMVMLAIAVVLFFPALGAGSLFGTEVRGFVSPTGISVLVGAFIFGVGMQLGGGCASGTLFTAGGGNARMLITLVFFIVGSVIGTAHFAWWQSLPAFQPVSLVNVAGGDVVLVIDGDFITGNGGNNINGSVVIDDDSSLTVFVGGKVSLGSNVKMPVTQTFSSSDRPTFSIFSSYESDGVGVNVDGGGRVVANIYAPYTKASINSGGNLFGSVRAKFVDVSGDGAIVYPSNSSPETGNGGGWQLVGWQ